MKFIVDRKEIIEALTWLRVGTVGWFTPRGLIRIEARGKTTIELSAETERHVERIRISGKVDTAGSTLLVGKNRILTSLRSTDDDSVSFVSNTKTMKITASRLRASLSVYELDTGRPGDSFQEGRLIDLHIGALNEVLPFSSADEYRPVLAAVHFNGVEYAATDSYRLAAVTVPERSSDVNITIPRSVVSALTRLGVEGFVSVRLSDDQRMIRAVVGNRTVIGELQEGDYPNYEALFPKEENSKAQIKATSQLRDAAERIGILSESIHKDMRGWYRDRPHIKISSNKSGFGGTASVKCDDDRFEIDFDGEVPTAVGFNPKFLVEFFAGTNVDNMFGVDSLKPWGIQEDAPYCKDSVRRRLIMPIRLRD